MQQSPIAIIGASCRFPGAASLHAFWELLLDGKEAIREIGEDRWSTRFYGHPRFPEAGKSYTWAAGTLDQVDGFDAAFFGISAREAEQMDPQQRLLLELAWETLEDAGIPAGHLKGQPVGVYVGASGTEYLNLRFGDPSSADPYFMTGNTLSIFSNRISYIFDFHGPSLTIDTACSSSLVALHVACEDIRHGRVPMALVGGVNLLLSPYPFIGFSQARMLSQNGRCFSFDARADGYVRGEGGGAVLLKPLEQALEDGDRVRGVILASGTNSDGRTIGLSLPNQTLQESLLKSVYEEAGIDPNDLAFVEAHGTGTAAGDPIEASAIGNVLGTPRNQPLFIGSAKTNIGHLEAASGFAGLLKTILALEHGILPKSLNFEKPNPSIDFVSLNLQVASQSVPLSQPHCSAVAGVSGFGFGGTNAHLIVKAAPTSIKTFSDPPKARAPLLLSARSTPALRDTAMRWRRRLAGVGSEEQARLIRSAARRRDHHQHRLAIFGDALESLDDFIAGKTSPALFSAGTAKSSSQAIAFVFSGNGAQWAGMGREALAASPAFRAELIEIDRILGKHLDWSILDVLENDSHDMARTDVAQPLLFAIQVAIVEVLSQQGVKASAVLGHSVGEIAAAWAAGILSLDDAAFLVVTRSHHQQATAGKGRMAVVRAIPEEILEAANAAGSSVEIAAYNSAKSLTLAGTLEALTLVGKEARRRGLPFTMLDLDYAFHSAAMDSVRDGLISDLGRLKPQEGDTAFVSSVEGGCLSGAELGSDYWWRNIREAVRFAEAATAVIRSGITLFLEIGPSAVLQSYIRDVLDAEGSAGDVLPTLIKSAPVSDPFPGIAASCYVSGYALWKAQLFDGPNELNSLPLYPWQRERHWIRFTGEALDLFKPFNSHWLLGFRWRDDQNEWSNHLDTTLHPWLNDHKVGESIVLPAAAVIDGALAAAHQKEPGSPLLELRDLEIRRPVLLSSDQTRELRFKIETDGKLSLSSRNRFSDDAWAIHASGRTEHVDPASKILAALPDWHSRSRSKITKEAIYKAASHLGLHYGAEFQAIEAVSLLSQDEAWVDFECIEPLERSLIDPRLLDCALQGLLGILGNRINTSRHMVMLPWRFDRIRFSATAEIPIGAHVTIRKATERAVVADLVLFDASGLPTLAIEGCWLQPVQVNRPRAIDQNVFRFERIPAPLKTRHINFNRHREVRDAEVTSSGTALLAEAFIASSAYGAIKKVVGRDQAFTPEALVRFGRISSEALPLFVSLLYLLARHDAVAQQEETWTLTGSPELTDAGDVWRSLFYDAPGLPAVSVLLAWAASQLEGFLTQGLAVRDAPPSALLDELLFGGEIGDRLVQLLFEEIKTVVEASSEARTWRIFDLDASNGMLARKLRYQLDALSIDYEFVVGASAENLTRCAEAVAGWSAAQTVDWSSDDLSIRSYVSGGFDIVLSGQWLSATPKNHADLIRLKSLLATGGRLIAVEPEPNPILDFVLGLDHEWWSKSLTPVHPVSPLLSVFDWENLLIKNGFANIQTAKIPLGPWELTLFKADHADEVYEAENFQRTVIIVGQVHSLASALRRRLEKDSVSTIIAAPDNLHKILPGTKDATVLLLADEGQHFAGEEVVVDLANRLFETAKIVSTAQTRSAELLLVTRQFGSLNRISSYPFIGIARVATNEMTELRCRRIDIASDMSDNVAADCIARELQARTAETEVSWESRGRFVPRLRRGLPRAPQQDTAYKLIQDEPGFLDSLSWEQTNRTKPATGEVEIEVHAAGLNFRDVMWAMALLPGEALLDGFAGPTLGMECSGLVSAVGDGVNKVGVGDRVMAFAPAALSSHTVTLASCISPIPETLDFASAATMPVAFITVLYGLGTLAHLRAGETVLIHGGAGGVGLAAVQFAQHIGASIIATAGSSAKRAMLRLTGVPHVLDSRSQVFADEVMQITGGKGVDVVLNSLSGDAMEKSLRLLAPFGRFVELGKRDFYESTRVSVRPLRHNISYFAVDADELVARKPEIATETMAALRELLQIGALKPLPHIKFGFGQVTDAFRLMRSSGHVGKIVLTPEAIMPRPKRERLPPLFDAEKTLLIVGGLSGFGLATIRWFVETGAKHVALVSRRGSTTPGYHDVFTSLKKSGAQTIECFSCDASDEGALAAVLTSIRAAMPPIVAVVHAAMVVEDNLLASVTAEEIERVLQPKLGGALALDRLTRQDSIELFLLFSSATTLLGAPGQASYVAANMALEALAMRRQSEGLPGIAVGWGPIADAGYLADRPAAREALARRLGAVPISAEYALSSLPVLISSGLPIVSFAEVDWTIAKHKLPILSEPMFSGVSNSARRAEAAGSNESFDGKTPEEVQEIVQGVLIDEIATILRVARADLDPNRPLTEVGMDSLMAVELKLGVERRLHLEFPALALNDSVTVASMAKRLAARLGETPEREAVPEILLQYENAEDLPGEMLKMRVPEKVLPS